MKLVILFITALMMVPIVSFAGIETHKNCVVKGLGAGPREATFTLQCAGDTAPTTYVRVYSVAVQAQMNLLMNAKATNSLVTVVNYVDPSGVLMDSVQIQ